MPATKTLSQLRAMARELADMETGAPTTAFVDNTELNARVNEGCKRLYNLLIRARGQPFYSKTSNISTVSGTAAYALPADFYLLNGVIADDGTSYYALPVWMPLEKAWLKTTEGSGGGNSVYDLKYRLLANNIEIRPKPGAVFTLELSYVPTFTELAVDADTFDGINGWEKLAALYAAIDMLNKEESDSSKLSMERDRLEMEVFQLAGARDTGAPEEIQDRRGDWAGNWEWSRKNTWWW